ncbi:vacuolar transporter chaperone [Irineochytrium annulatum]|nr:vacuolar transporter chaperone [Irineochytrium annulatum]
MKFGQQLEEVSAEHAWNYYYIDYNELKRVLKERTASGKFTEQDEAAFVDVMERELEKVFVMLGSPDELVASFRQMKGDELSRRVDRCETGVLAIVNKKPPFSDEDENRLKAFKNDVDLITGEVTELERYSRTNYTGFMKILKKHDKRTQYQLKPMFLVRMNARPFFKESVDHLIVRLSHILEMMRVRKPLPLLMNGMRGTPRPGVQSDFQRKTKKYWVRIEDVTSVKCEILKHLPVLIVNGKGGTEPSPAVSSVYLDNSDFDLYTSRVDKRDGGEAVRLRWYGNMDTNEIYVERKIHHDLSSTETSTKSRFSLKEKYVNSYLKGTYKAADLVKKVRERGGRTEQQIDDLVSLATEIQQKILTRKLKPVLRTFYNRTAFQIPGDSKVRLSLDTDLTFIREDNFDRDRSGANWRRIDCGVTTPFDYLPKGDVSTFPFAILEIKVEESEPEWVNEILKHPGVTEMNSFSKFVHGVAVLLDTRVTILPFWLNAVELGGTTPMQLEKGKAKSIAGATDHDDELTVAVSSRRGDHTIDMEGPGNVIDSVSSTNAARRRAAAGKTDETTPLLAGPSSSSAAAPRGDVHPTSTTWWAWWSQVGKQQHSTPGGGRPNGPAPVVGPDGKALPPNKRIALPVRVEPKVFFANERTFLSWLHFSIVLGGLALGLLNFGDRVGQISGLMFTLIAMLFMVYSLFLYQWRAQKIRNRDPGPYDDLVGPTVLVVVLFCAVSINFYLKFSTDNKVF